MAGAPSPEDVLKQLELILAADPLIDEVGFIHPSQFPQLIKEADSLSKGGDGESAQSHSCSLDLNFWTGDHKLGISTVILLPLYKAAKTAFMEAHSRCKMLTNLSEEISNSEDDNGSTCTSHSPSPVEIEAMKHSRALLLLSCDFGTAWNLRKTIVAKMQRFQLFLDELVLSSLVLSYSPKSERAWSHRRWVIKKIAGKCSNLEEVIQRESEFVEKLAEVSLGQRSLKAFEASGRIFLCEAKTSYNLPHIEPPKFCIDSLVHSILHVVESEKSKMNYRAWNHRCWLVDYMSKEQMLHELNQSQPWAGLHVSDNSCFHYRTRLLLKILEVSSHKPDAWASSNTKLHELWEKELDWVEQLIRHYVGREALWLHRRFLSYCWIRYFIPKIQSESCDSLNVETFMESEIQLCQLTSAVPDDDFEDYEAQATFSATYIMWLSREVSGCFKIDAQKKLEAYGFKTLLDTLCPEKSVLWDTL